MTARLPTESLELSGTLAKNPDRARARADEPRDTPPLDVENEPVCLDPLELVEWRMLVAQSHRGVLREADANILIIAAKIVTASKYCVGAPDNGLAAMAAKYLGLLGMTPVDRSKVSAPKSDDKPAKYGSFGQPKLVS